MIRIEETESQQPAETGSGPGERYGYLQNRTLLVGSAAVTNV